MIASGTKPLPALTFSEIIATSDLPGGVVNVLAGDRAELAPHIASHMDVNAIVDASGDEEVGRQLQRGGGFNVKRYVRRSLTPAEWRSEAAENPYWILDTVEMKTAWHPIGSRESRLVLTAASSTFVLDSVGIGGAPDAEKYGDSGADTLGHIFEQHPELQLPTLCSLGLPELLEGRGGARLRRAWSRCRNSQARRSLALPPYRASYGRMQERSVGQGHDDRSLGTRGRRAR